MGADVNAVENRWKMTPLHYIAFVEAANSHQNDWTEDDYLGNFHSIRAIFYQIRLCTAK